jgi:hypothetical protein
MTEDQQQSESTRRRRSSRHSGRSHGRHGSSSRRSSDSSGGGINLTQVLLLIWSIAAMFGFVWFLEDEQHAPLSVAIGLAVATVLGLILFFRTLPRKK